MFDDDEPLGAYDSKRDPCLQRRRAFMVTDLAAHGHWRWAGTVSTLRDDVLHIHIMTLAGGGAWGGQTDSNQIEAFSVLSAR